MKKKNHKMDCATETVLNAEFVTVARTESFNIMTIVEEAIESGNLNMALRQIELIANSGNAEAAYLLSKIYIDGEICKEDYKKSKQFLAMAATLGNVNAMVDLAAITFRMEDDSIEKELSLFGWIHEAAINGHPESEMILSSFYAAGFGCEKNLKLAEIWGIKAHMDNYNHELAMSIMGYNDENDV